MNKTLALIAALGLVVSAPAFANEAAKTETTKMEKTEHAEKAEGVKKEEKKAEKTVAVKKHHAKKAEGKEESKAAPAAGEKTEGAAH